MERTRARSEKERETVKVFRQGRYRKIDSETDRALYKYRYVCLYRDRQIDIQVDRGRERQTFRKRERSTDRDRETQKEKKITKKNMDKKEQSS